MGQKVKNQHYIPRMYLKRFSSDGKRICVWNLMNDEIMSRQQPNNFASRKYFYDASKEELKDAMSEMLKLYPHVLNTIEESDGQLLEHALSRVESDVAIIMDEIIDNPQKLYDKSNMQKLIVFLHDLTYRTEIFREQLDDVKGKLLQHLEKMGVDETEIDGWNQTGRDYQLYQLLGIAPLIKTAGCLIENYNWYYGIVKGDMKLLISDNPAYGTALGFNDICIPLCGDRAIIFRIKDKDAPILSTDLPQGNEIILSERSVYAYNAVQLSYANRFMFGDRSSMLLLKSFCNRRGGHKALFDKFSSSWHSV